MASHKHIKWINNNTKQSLLKEQNKWHRYYDFLSCALHPFPLPLCVPGVQSCGLVSLAIWHAIELSQWMPGRKWKAGIRERSGHSLPSGWPQDGCGSVPKAPARTSPHNSFLWVFGSTSQFPLGSLNPDNPFINLSSIILLSVHLFPTGNLTDGVASPSPHKTKSHSRNWSLFQNSFAKVTGRQKTHTQKQTNKNTLI